MTTLYNANTRSAYQAGYFTGSFTIGELLRDGDTGLGALDTNDGELVIDGGVAWRTAADGTTHPLPPEARTPFATVVGWRTAETIPIEKPLRRSDFEAAVGARLPLANRTWALRIHGTFASVTAGASGPQVRPYRPLAEVMTEYRRHTWTETTGTLVAFYSPVYLTGIVLVGFHYHWLAADHRGGGHVFDFATREVTVEACPVDAYTTRLPDTAEFHDLDLAPFHGAVQEPVHEPVHEPDRPAR